MFAAFLADVSVWQPLLRDPVLRESLAWLEKNAAGAELGDHPLGRTGWYANVHGYAPLPEADCIWENHERTIDIQYLVHGHEGIRWGAVSQLGASLRYFEEMDRQEFAAPARGVTSLFDFHPGMFAIFLPGDAHCPKIRLTDTNILRKVVVKIPVRLLEDMA